MANQTPYIGSKISLISKLDIRYEGVLFSVNTADSTIALIKVRTLGTEDRHVTNPVPAKDEIYEHIIFKAADIKDLIVCETPKQPTLGGLPYDPAIVSVSNRPEPGASAGSSRPATPGRASPIVPPSNRAPGAGRQSLSGPPGPRGAPQGGQHYFRGNSGPQPLMGGRGMRGGFARNAPNPREKLRYESDYDFEKANEQFQESLTDLLKDKLNINEAEEKKIESEGNSEDEKDEAFYDKSNSFFDRISCEALEKADGKRSRPDWRKERETNQETFGHQAVRSLNYRRGFGMRGVRGGPMGGHRYNNGGNNYNNGGGYNGGGGYNNGYNRSYQGNNGGYNGRGGFRRNYNNQNQQSAQS